MTSWRSVHLDAIEPVSVDGDDFALTWHPVRAALGIRAFGTNAYTARSAGDDVVEPHTETGGSEGEPGHEELYFVARGHATFRLDGEELDAPAGTYVFIPDPATHRHAVAVEPGTTVLSFGGPPTFTPSAWEWIFRAEAQADHARAVEILRDGLTVRPANAALRYHLARHLAAAGDTDAARQELEAALRQRAELRDEALADDALAPLM